MPLKRLFTYSLSLLILTLHVSCSDFSRLQKTGSPEEKLSKAIEYYDTDDNYKAGVLLEDVTPLLRGKADAEKAAYYLANNYFKQDQFMLSAFYFKDFYLTYPRSKHVEETMYMHIYSLYKNSAEYNLDQTSTYECLKAMSGFVTRYPNSVYMDQCNVIASELNHKLMHKAFLHSMMYHKVGNYKSAVVAINTFIKEYPSSIYLEDSYFTRFEAQYHLAYNSVHGTIQLERYFQALEYYQLFVEKYADSKHKSKANDYYDKIIKSIEEIKSIEK
jgi:outer membrane protein assembly factor BamD